MKTQRGITPYLLQLSALGTGIVLITTSPYWSDPILAAASGIFFINIFWITVILGHDIRIWSFLRNSKTGNLFMIGLILANLAFILLKALVNLFQ